MATTFEEGLNTGQAPEALRTRVCVRCYRHYGDAKRARDRLSVVARIPDTRMIVVARGLEWREDLPLGALYKVACWMAAAVGAAVGLVLWALGITSAGTGWLTPAVLAALVGTGIGFLIATAVARLRSRRTGVADTGHVDPRQYDILVEPDFAPAARQALDAE